MINYINRQGFEALFDFIIYPQQTWRAYWDKYKQEGLLYWGISFQYETFVQKNGTKPSDQTNPNLFLRIFYWVVPPLHFLFGFLSRVALLPFTATAYVLSRTFLVVLNPLSWWNNTAKLAFMTLSFVLPIFIALNNAYEWIPLYSFNALFAPDQLRTLSNAFGISEGFWLIGPEVTGGFIAASLMMTVVATGLYLAKKVAQSWNAVTFYDPYTEKALLRTPVTVTAPKHAYYANKGMLPNHTELQKIAKGKNKNDTAAELAITDNPYYDLNCAYVKLVYDYYRLEKKHAIDDQVDTRVPIKQVLDKTDKVMKDHHHRKLTQESLVELINVVKPMDAEKPAVPRVGKQAPTRQHYLYDALAPEEGMGFVVLDKRLWRQALGGCQDKRSQEPGRPSSTQQKQDDRDDTNDDNEEFQFLSSSQKVGSWRKQ